MATLREVIEHASEVAKQAQVPGTTSNAKDPALAYCEGVLDVVATLQAHQITEDEIRIQLASMVPTRPEPPDEQGEFGR